MKDNLKLLILFLFLGTCLDAFSQNETLQSEETTDEPVFYTQAVKEWKKQLKEWKKPIPTSFELYEVKLPGETVKNIARLYKILPEDIYANNADATNGLKMGMILEIPRYDKLNDEEEETKIIYAKEFIVVDNDGKSFEKKVYALKLGKNETLETLAEIFETTVDDIIKTNQKAVKEGIKQGTELKIITTKTGIPKFTKPVITTEIRTIQEIDSAKVVTNTLPNTDDILPEANSNEIKETIIPKPALKENEHWVEPKETLYSISKKYNVTLDDIYALNPEVKTNGLKQYNIIKIKKEIGEVDLLAKNTKPNTNQEEIPVNNIKETPETIIHEVASGETIFGLARKYNTSIKEITENNPEVKNGLKIGQKLVIKNSLAVKKAIELKSTNEETDPEKKNKIETNTEIISPKNAETIRKEDVHIVKSDETLVDIAKKYGIKVETILENNPFLIDNDLLEGQKLKIRQN